MLTLLLASLGVSFVSSREQCTENLALDGYFELDETDCTFCFCSCEVNTATGDLDCGYDCSLSYDPNAATVDSLEMIIQYCGLNCGAQEVLYDDDSTSTVGYCSCDRIYCDGDDDDDDSTPKPTRNTDPDDGDDPNATEDPDKQTQRPVVTTIDNGDDSDDTRVTDDPDDPNDPDPTTDADRVTKEPEPTQDDGDNNDPDPTRDDNDDSDDDNNTRVTDEPEPTRDDDDDSDDDTRVTDEPQETKVDDDSDDDDNVRETPTPTERKYDDDYDLSSQDEDDFLDDDDVDVIDSDDDSKPYLVTEFKFTLTKVWYYRPDFDSILKRAIRILLALSEDYDDDAAARYIIKFEADRTDDDGDDDETTRTETKTTRTDESDDDTRTADNEDTDAATTADDGRGRRLLEDDALNTADSDSTREPQTTKGDNGGTSVIQTDPATEPEETRDSSDSDDDYRTTIYIDDKCDDVTLSIYVGIAVYIDDIDIIIRLYNWLLSIGNTLGDEFAIYCEDSAVLYRECGWGEVDVYYASVAYYDENGDLIESETYDGGDDDGPSGTSNANIANIGMGVMVLLSAVSLFNLW